MQNSRELELLSQIKDLQNELKILKKQKKYGLVWEEKEEKIDKNNLPIFAENTDLRIHENEENPINLIIEGDNFHTLSALQYTHFGKIDVIYIDPPYNTGNKDFVYNDNYVDKEDTFRHSKWLSFMEKRLKLARNLLKNDGVIFISIDDNEFAQLKLLCDEVFGEGNFESFIWKKKGGASNTEKIIGGLTEYIFCYFKNKKSGIFNYRKIERKFKFKDELGNYNLEGIEKTNSGVYERKTMLFGIIDRKTGKVFYPSKGMRWTIGEEKIKKLSSEGRLFFDYKKEKVYLIKREDEYEDSENIFYNLLLDFGSLSVAKTNIENILGSREIFSTPKPKELIKHLFEISSKPNSIILDFFAGSGTTGHAVLELNKEDAGNRQFILCSNRENTKENPEKNICRDITYERNKRVIMGYINTKGEKIEGLGGNLRYYKTEFIAKNPEKSLDDLRYSFMQKCDDLLCIKEDIFTKIEKNDLPETIKIFKRKNKFLLVCYDISHFEKLSKILKIFDKTEKVSVYIFTLKNDIIAEFDNLGTNISIKNIPDEILETYKKIFFK